MKKSLKTISRLFTIALTLATPQLSHAMETGFEDIHEELRSVIVKQAAYEQCLEEKNPVTLNKTLVNLALVCKEWQDIINDDMQVGKLSWKTWYGVPRHEEFYERFLKGVLVYRPNPQSNEGMIELRISDLKNPLEGTFDLSQCGDTENYLSISTGYRKGKKQENANKLEIWIAPRFLIEKVSTTAAHFQPHMDDWKQEQAPVGLFWTWGSWAADAHNMDYLTTENTDNLSKINLHENWKKSRVTLVLTMSLRAASASCAFTFRL